VASGSGSGRVGAAAVASFLRVYEPLEAFPADERVWWRAVAAAGPPTAADMAAREHSAALRAMIALPARVVSDHDLVDGAARPVGIVLQPDAADGRLRVCPTELTWRALLALEEFQTDIPPAVLPSFLPTGVIDAASVELARLVSERSSLTGPHARSCRWSVPLAWFAVFQPSHREPDPPSRPTSSRARRRGDPQLEAGQNDDTETDVEGRASGVHQPAPTPAPVPFRVSRYRASMADARRCLARALAAARVAETAMLPIAELEELGRWLEEFHARAVLELDASGLGALLDVSSSGPASSGVLDESVLEVNLGLGELRAGKVDDAIERLAGVRDRWDEIQAHEHAS
jgi:hypothetical protein